MGGTFYATPTLAASSIASVLRGRGHPVTGCVPIEAPTDVHRRPNRQKDGRHFFDGALF